MSEFDKQKEKKKNSIAILSLFLSPSIFKVVEEVELSQGQHFILFYFLFARGYLTFLDEILDFVGQFDKFYFSYFCSSNIDAGLACFLKCKCNLNLYFWRKKKRENF